MSSPVSPVPPTAPAIPTTTIAGSLFAQGGRLLAGETITAGTVRTTTDNVGRFSMQLPSGTVLGLTITGPNLVQRSTQIRVDADLPCVELEAIEQDGRFDMTYYRQLARDAFDQPGALRPIRRWNGGAPYVLVRTVDEAGTPVDLRLVSMVSDTLRDFAGHLASFGVAGIETGSATTRGNQPGWITVRFVPGDPADRECGAATQGQNPGFILLYHQKPGCGCSQTGLPVSQTRVLHEYGHVMGFFHTGELNDVMSGRPFACMQDFSVRERYHALIALRRPNGNTDPDNDAAETVLQGFPPAQCRPANEIY